MKTDEAIQQLKARFENAILKETHFFDEITLEVRKEKLKEIL